MKRTLLTISASVLLALAATGASAQQSYSYYVQRTIPINWRPDTKEVQRYTVAVHPFHLVNNGLKFDFEYELRTPGEWLQVGLLAYLAPERNIYYYEDWWGYGGHNPRSTFNSGFDNYNRMWGIGASAMFKKMWHSRGWYFSTGIVLEYYRVGNMEEGYFPYTEDGLTFYKTGSRLISKSFVKPTAQFNLGKHCALSRRCYLDMFIGISASYSIYNSEYAPAYYDSDYGNYYYEYQSMNGFARRGFNFNCGLRFGVLLWDRQ